MLEIISRREAHAQGKRRFFTGRPCAKGHIGERYVSSGSCMLCTRFPTRHPSPYRKGWVSFDASKLWVPLGTTKEHQKQLENYLQECIDTFFRHKGMIP